MAKKMKQGYNSRMDESLGARNGKKKQSMKDRRDESKAMNKKTTGRAYSSVATMDRPKKKKVSAAAKTSMPKPSRATRVAARKMVKQVAKKKGMSSKGARKMVRQVTKTVRKMRKR